MSLFISVDIYDERSGERKEIPLEYHVFGFESARQTLWNKPIFRELGLILLPELGNGAWLVVEGTQLDRLDREAQIIIDNLPLIYERTQYPDPRLAEYMRNLLTAISEARR